MIELVALVAVLMTIANMASDRHLNVKVLLLVAGVGWVVLAILFRYVLLLGLVPALMNWVFVLGVLTYVYFKKIPERVRTYEGLEELMESMGHGEAVERRGE